MKIEQRISKLFIHLLEWARDNDYTGLAMTEDKDNVIEFSNGLMVNIKRGKVERNDIFLIKREIEIDMDTKLNKVYKYNDVYEKSFKIEENQSLRFIVKGNMVDPKAVYIMNDDYEMILIWTEKKGMIK